LAGDAGYGSAEMQGWLVDERGIEPRASVRQVGAVGRNFFPRRPAYDARKRSWSAASPSLGDAARILPERVG
jgi:hypothetical protein